jgi:hypothetical protein
MKNVIIGILLVVSVALGGLLIQNGGKAKQAEAKLAALQKQMDDMQAAQAEAETRAANLRTKLEAAQVESVSNAGAAAQLSQALTNQLQTLAEESTNAKPANPFAEMFKNPEMRDMIKNQQKTVLGGMIDKNYADFFKSMNLTPEQQKAMKDLLLEKMLGGAELGMEMMSGELTAEQRAELTKKMKEAGEAINQQLKDLLGAENYSQFEIYEKTIQDRQPIETFKNQLPADAQLTANQEQLLISAVSEERQNFKFTTDFSNQQDFSADTFSRFTEERINLFLQEQDQLNQKYLARAQPILSAEQYTAYQKSLKNQQEMLKMTMTMAAKMFQQ